MLGKIGKSSMVLVILNEVKDLAQAD